MRLPAFLSVAVVVLALAGPAAGSPVPATFFGVMANGPLLGPCDLPAEMAVMKGSGVGTIRLPVEWSDLQPYRSLDEVPAGDRSRFTVVDGIPTDFGPTDRRVLAAAGQGIDVLALVNKAPPWAEADPAKDFSPPRSPEAYGRFLQMLVARYGPNGSLWAENPSVRPVPMRRFQVWNEPSLPRYFAVSSFARPYVRLLAAAYRAVKAVDPGATVVTAGLPNFSWRDLEKLYRAGLRARGHFDAVAIHPFTGEASGRVEILRRVRAVMNENGDRRSPIWVTEVSWPSGRGKAEANQRWVTTEAGQARKVTEVYRAFARARGSLRLQRAYWYTWVTTDTGSSNAFDYAGLRTVAADGAFVDKPALSAYRSVSRSLTGR